MFKQQVSFVVMAVDNFHKKQLNPINYVYSNFTIMILKYLHVWMI